MQRDTRLSPSLAEDVGVAWERGYYYTESVNALISTVLLISYRIAGNFRGY